MLSITQFFLRVLAIVSLSAFSYMACADVLAELESLDSRVNTEIPMPIGEVISKLETRLLNPDLTSLEKTKIAVRYVQLKLKLHHTAPDDVMTILESLVSETSDGLIIKLGLARMVGINANYDRSYQMFGEVIQSPAASPTVKAMAIAYLILSYNEGQVFASSVNLLNTLNELVHENNLAYAKALYHYMAADYYHSVKSFDIAFEYYEKSLAEAKSLKEWPLVSDNLYAIGILFRNMGNYDKAITYFEQTIESDTKIDINYAEYIALYGMASTYFRTDNIAEALKLADTVTSHPLTTSFYDSEIYRLKAKALMERGRLSEARVALDQSRSTYDDYRVGEKTTWRAELEKLASQITAKEGDFETAYKEYQTYHNEYLEAKKYEDLELLESANLVYEIQQQKEKTTLLEKENLAISELLKAKEDTQQTQKLFTRWLVIFIVLALVTLVIILILLKKARKTNALYISAKEKAELHSRLKTEFISNISHEIRTPLNAIIGFGQVLTDKLEDRQTKKLTSQIVNSSEMLLQLINDLLDFSKIEAGKLTLDYGPYNLRQSIRKLLDIFHAQASNKGLTIKLNIDKNLPKEMIFDELRLKQVLANLISNAIKFSSAGVIEIGIKVKQKDDTHCLFDVWVQDNGIGISKSQQENLFQPFIQAESSTARKYGGSGLGLNICNKLLEQMNSKLHVDSDMGKGARFYFTLELSHSIGDEYIHNQEATQLITQFQKTRVLLAEDNDINVEVITAMLNSTNLQILRVANGNDAIHKLSQQSFDAILMDIQMPEMDGYEATRVIRHQMNGTLPIIALTANAMQQDIDACLNAGMDDHVSKPIRKEKLLEVLDKYLNA
ncbi:hybrid sensor histidine kinase/response regulator [Alteromonas stellipolaris]|uniref:hybrid sensor histidine kinase/response regulator n=1 Tax=Alteromonas stellipolaris TaxID=233316 RepID=UPI0026E3C8BF|nr:ATP-binding protein [Alteromonas stellipolaris]MDO6536769.1 ATP-binding protein [Alteromonas stellipolaris]MDO6625657.1 ATP-binding protein [Alteromonas stellipolaris]